MQAAAPGRQSLLCAALIQPTPVFKRSLASACAHRSRLPPAHLWFEDVGGDVQQVTRHVGGTPGGGAEQRKARGGLQGGKRHRAAAEHTVAARRCVERDGEAKGGTQEMLTGWHKKVASQSASAALCSTPHLAAALTLSSGVSPTQLTVAATSQSCACSSTQGSSSAKAPSARRGWEAAAARPCTGGRKGRCQ